MKQLHCPELQGTQPWNVEEEDLGCVLCGLECKKGGSTQRWVSHELSSSAEAGTQGQKGSEEMEAPYPLNSLRHLEGLSLPLHIGQKIGVKSSRTG